MQNSERPSKWSFVWVPLLIILTGAMFIMLLTEQVRERRVLAASQSDVILAEEECRIPQGNIKDFGFEFRQQLYRRAAMSPTELIMDDYIGRELRGQLEYAERCWQHFTFEASGISEEDLSSIGYLPRGRRP